MITDRLQAAWDAHGAEILRRYTAIAAASRPGSHLDQLHDRALKHMLLSVMIAGVSTPSVFASRVASTVSVNPAELCRELLSSPFMSDRSFGLARCLELPLPDRDAVMVAARREWAQHPVSTEAFISVIASLDCDEAPRLIRELVDHSGAGEYSDVYNVNLSGHARSVARCWAAQRKRSLLTDDGLALTCYLLVSIGKVNQMSAQAILATFADVSHFPPGEQRDKLLDAIVAVRGQLDPVSEQSLYGNLTTLLARCGRGDTTSSL